MLKGNTGTLSDNTLFSVMMFHCRRLWGLMPLHLPEGLLPPRYPTLRQVCGRKMRTSLPCGGNKLPPFGGRLMGMVTRPKPVAGAAGTLLIVQSAACVGVRCTTCMHRISTGRGSEFRLQTYRPGQLRLRLLYERSVCSMSLG